jgi:hypothetical protein
MLTVGVLHALRDKVLKLNRAAVHLHSAALWTATTVADATSTAVGTLPWVCQVCVGGLGVGIPQRASAAECDSGVLWSMKRCRLLHRTRGPNPCTSGMTLWLSVTLRGGVARYASRLAMAASIKSKELNDRENGAFRSVRNRTDLSPRSDFTARPYMHGRTATSNERVPVGTQCGIHRV